MRDLAALLLAALAGAAACADPPDRAEIPDTATAPPAATADSAPTSADSAAWTVTDRGAGPLAIGMTAAAAGRALGAPLQPTYEPGGTCDMIDVPGGPAGLSLMLVSDTLVRVDVVDTLPRTREGVGVGSGEAAVLAAYAPHVASGPHKYDAAPARYLTATSPTDSSHAIVFETDGQRVTRYRAGRRPEVEWVEGCS